MANSGVSTTRRAARVAARVGHEAHRLAARLDSRYEKSPLVLSGVSAGRNQVQIGGQLYPAEGIEGQGGTVAVVNVGSPAVAKYAPPSNRSVMALAGSGRAAGGGGGGGGGGVVYLAGEAISINGSNEISVKREAAGAIGLGGAGGLKVNIGAGIKIDSNAVAIDLASNPGIEYIAGLRVKTYHGILRDSNGIRVQLKTTSGLAVDGTGLSVGPGDGIDLLTSSIAVDVTDFIDTMYGLEENSNDIRVKRDTNSGLLFGGGGGLALGTPSNVSVTSVNQVLGTGHTHAVTASFNPGATASIMRTSTNGSFQFDTNLLVVDASNDIVSIDTDLLYADGPNNRVGINRTPGNAAVDVITKANSDHTLRVKQKSGQTGRLWRVEDTVGDELIVLDSQGNLQSGKPGFVSGLTGWQITPTGTAEFNNVWVRGELHATIFVKDEIHASGGTLLIATAGKSHEDVKLDDDPLDAIFAVDTAVEGFGTRFILQSSNIGADASMKITSNIDFLDIEDPPSGPAFYFDTNDVIRSKTEGSNRGTFIYDGLITGPGPSTPVDFGAAGSSGGTAYLVVQAITGSPTNATIRIQSSSTLGGVYDDEAIFTFSNVGLYQLPLLGTVNRWVRISVTNLGGAANFRVVASAYVGGVSDGTEGISDFWLKINKGHQHSGYARYSVSKKSGTPGILPAGSAVVSYGQPGDGRILLTSDLNYAPYIDVFTIGPNVWTGGAGSIIPHVRMGRLDGLGVTSVSGIKQFGIVAGTDLSNANSPHIVVSNLQLRLFKVNMGLNDGTNDTGELTAEGNLKLGTNIANTDGTSFQVIANGTDKGDVIIGRKASSYVWWDQSDQVLRVNGTLSVGGSQVATHADLSAISSSPYVAMVGGRIYVNSSGLITWDTLTLRFSDGATKTVTAGNYGSVPSVGQTWFLYVNASGVSPLTMQSTTSFASVNPASGHVMLAIATRFHADAAPALTPVLGSTIINGGSILTGTITAHQMSANSIYAGHIKAGEIKVGHLDVDAVLAGNIKAGEIKAGHLDVDAVLAGNIKAGEIKAGHIGGGEVSADKININSSIDIAANGAIRGNGKTYGSATSGFFLGDNGGTYMLDIGNSSAYLRWTGSDLVFRTVSPIALVANASYTYQVLNFVRSGHPNGILSFGIDGTSRLQYNLDFQAYNVYATNILISEANAIRISNPREIPTSFETGAKGDISWYYDSGTTTLYLYVCIANNNWRRFAVVGGSY